MPYYSKEDIARAREMDLLTYLEMYEPTELVHVRGSTYTADGGAEPYVHGEAKDAKYTISLTSDLPEELSEKELAAALQGIAGMSEEQGEAASQEDEISYVLLSEEDIEKEYVNQQ